VPLLGSTTPTDDDGEAAPEWWSNISVSTAAMAKTKAAKALAPAAHSVRLAVRAAR
jgi:hypothetical protein